MEIMPQLVSELGLLARGPKLSIAPASRTISWLIVSCLTLATLQPTCAMGRQVPPNSIGRTSDSAQSAVPGQQNVEDYLATARGPIEVPRLGIAVRNGSATLKHGEVILGAVVTAVSPTGPAKVLTSSHASSHLILEGALFGTAIAAALLFPPAMVGVTTIACYFADSDDLLIAVDGHRVRNSLDLAELIEGVRSGDTVYLVILRKGLRLQVPVQIH
jgi:S1-C subfamily serine protease